MNLTKFIIPIIALIIQPIILQAQSTNEPSIKSLPTGTITRIAFGSCAKHWQYQPIWKTVISKNPDLFLYVGDAIYADTDGKTAWQVSEKQLRGEWARLADKPEFKEVRSKIPFMATWDNHDYGTHQGGSEFTLKEESKEAFLDFFNEPKESDRRKHAGIYDAKVFGEEGQKVEIILLDTRSFKGKSIKDTRSKSEKKSLGIAGNYLPNEDPSVTLLGKEQWKWLERELKNSVQLRIIVSSTQIIADQKHMDEWGNYPLERKKLFDLIDRSTRGATLLLSGNAHFSEISELNTKHYNLLDFTSSGLTHVNNTYAQKDNKYRVKGPFADLNFGYIEIDWENANGPTITLQSIGLDGTIAYSLKRKINALDKMQ